MRDGRRRSLAEVSVGGRLDGNTTLMQVLEMLPVGVLRTDHEFLILVLSIRRAQSTICRFGHHFEQLQKIQRGLVDAAIHLPHSVLDLMRRPELVDLVGPVRQIDAQEFELPRDHHVVNGPQGQTQDHDPRREPLQHVTRQHRIHLFGPTNLVNHPIMPMRRVHLGSSFSEWV